jgi:hypothetical protein
VYGNKKTAFTEENLEVDLMKIMKSIIHCLNDNEKVSSFARPFTYPQLRTLLMNHSPAYKITEYTEIKHSLITRVLKSGIIHSTLSLSIDKLKFILYIEISRGVCYQKIYNVQMFDFAKNETAFEYDYDPEDWELESRESLHYYGEI